MFRIILDLNDTLLPNNDRDGLLRSDLLQKVQGARSLKDQFQLVRGRLHHSRILRCGSGHDGEYLLESSGPWWG